MRDIHFQPLYSLFFISIIIFLGCNRNESNLITLEASIRDKYALISQEDVKELVQNKGYFDKYWNKPGGFENKFESHGLFIVDHATGLIWHQSGSKDFMNLEDAEVWLNELNNDSYAGFNDWRLPTLEEALTLLENKRLNGNLYIDPLFDNWQWCILTGDSLNESKNWLVAFSGRVDWFDSKVRINYVRPVCKKQN